jgi:hypothetical protein
MKAAARRAVADRDWGTAFRKFWDGSCASTLAKPNVHQEPVALPLE